MHSVYSDGTFTPEEIVLEAVKRKLDIIALTDHNTFDGIPEFLEAAG
ncbi:MAG: PHP domain-containing protein, partial [archaeon]|nr:PHP domain-containing protein [archaeon]